MPGQHFEAVSRPQDKGSTVYANPETPKPLKVTSAIQYPETLRGPRISMKQKTPEQSWAMYQTPQWEETLGWPEPGSVCLEALLHAVPLAKGQSSVPRK